MTVIKRMHVKGFKSFANKTDLVFGNGFNCILGPNGSGKCIDYHSLVQLKDGSLVKIGELVNEGLKEKSIALDDGAMSFPQNLEVLSLDLNTLKIVPRKVQALIKRQAPEKLLSITTRSGKHIAATEYHPLFILEDGKIRSIKAEELKEGVKIAIPRQIQPEIKTTYFYELLDLIKPEENIYVPYSEKFKEIIYKLKGKKEWKTLAQELNIPQNTFPGIISKQSINFSYLVKILRASGLNDHQITQLIPFTKSKSADILYKIPWKNSPALSKLLGYLLAEGRLPTTSDQIWFTNGTVEIIEEYKTIIDELFGINATVNEYKPNACDVLAYSTFIRTFLTKLGMPIGTTKDKILTNLYLSHSNEEELTSFLNGLYSGDGYVSDHSIEITTKSHRLAEAIETIFRRLNIFTQSKFEIKMATNSGFSGFYKTIRIYGVENFKIFAKKITFTHPEKQRKLEKLLSAKSNPNLDLLEVNHLIKTVTKELKINVKKTKKEFPRLDAYCYNTCTPSRYGVNHLIENLFLQSDHTSQSLLQLQTLAESDVYWDEITYIERFEPEHKWVYDLTVENDHNFIANGIIAHNSNVVDSLCFVLGKSSAKEMRAERSASLIYNGGKKKNPSKEAEVTIVFDNSEGKFPVKDKELAVTRVVRQNGTSVYKLNNETMTRQQVLDVLRLDKVDPDGHNIVLQGDIIGFMEMKPVERRMIIEEIAGISGFEEKKQKCLSELGKVDGQLNEAEIILKERETNLRELKKERDHALRYKELQENIKDEKATYTHLLIKNKEELVNEIEAKKKDCEEKISKVQEDIQEFKDAITQLQEEIKRINSEIEEKGEKEQLILRKEIDSLKEELIRAGSRTEVCSSEITKIKQRKQQLAINIQELEEKIKQLRNNKKELESTLKGILQEETSLQTKINQFKEKHGIESNLSLELEELEKTLEKDRGRFHELQQTKQDLIKTKTELDFKINALEEKINGIKGINKSKEFEDLKNKKNNFKDIMFKLSKSLNEDSSYAAQLAQARQKHGDVTEELTKLHARQITFMERSNADLAVKRILEQKSTLKGIHGTVSQLGKVDGQYALALEVAAGPRVQSVIVDSDATAQRCISYLKENKLGIATFLPLNKLKTRIVEDEVKKVLTDKSSHGLATDLIKYDPEYKSVFSYVFGSTVIIDTLEAARRIGVGRARMVTLEGDLLEPSGAMIGGFRGAKRTFSFNETNLDENIEKNQAEQAKIQKFIDHLQEKRVENELTISKLREEKANLEGDIIKLEKSLSIEGIDINSLLEDKKKLSEQFSSVEKDFLDIENEEKQINKNSELIKAKKTKLQEKLSNPELGKNLEELESQKLTLKEKLAELNANVKNIDMQIESLLLPETEKTSKIIKQHDTEEEKFNQELATLQDMIKKRQQELKGKENEESKFHTNLKDLVNGRNKLSEKIQGKQANIVREEEKVKAIEQKQNNISIDRAKAIAELESLQKEFEQYSGATIKRGFSIEQLKLRIHDTEKELNSIGNVNLRALDVYEQIEIEHSKLVEKTNKLKSEKEDVLKMMHEIEEKKKDIFMKTYDVIIENFKTIFSSLTTKGEAHVELENPENPFEGGMDIQIRLTGTKSLDVKSLSGGEKTLAALSFIFAIQEYAPSPFYIMDEVDAALDKRNSETLSKLVQQYSKKAQYIVISHNDAMIGEADAIYGVSMQDGVSKVVSLKV